MADPLQLPPSFSPRRRWQIGFDVVVRTMIVLAVVVMVNYLGARFFHRFYLSSQTRVQLSSRTLSVLHSLTNQVKVTLYYDKSDEMFPAIIGLLNEYGSANPRISIQVVDYVHDAGEAQKVKEKYQLNSAQAKNLVIFDCAGHSQIVPGDMLTQMKLEQVPNEKEREYRRKPVTFRGEMLFTSTLLSVLNPKPLKAYFLQGHSEPSLMDSDRFGYLTFGAILAQNYILVEPLKLLGDNAVPDDCNLLIIAGARTEFKEIELQKIDQYLTQGGRLFALLDYNSRHRPTGLEPILASRGVNVGNDVVQDTKATYTGQDLVAMNFSQHPLVGSLVGSGLYMILPRPVSRVDWQNPPADAPKVDELVFSGTTSTLTDNPGVPPRAYPLMVAVEQKPVAGVANTRGTMRMVVTGDSIFLSNQSIENAGNRDFLGYAVNWLLDRSVLLEGIGPRPVTEFRLIMTHGQQTNVRWLLLGALPGGVLALGWLVWLVRRK